MPSRSALMAAAARAAHLEVDQPPFLFEDTLARRMLGNQADELLSYHHKSGSHPVLMGTRLAVTTRARYAEDRLAKAIARGIEQYVILGAGLDTFAYRSTMASGVMVYEVDEPDTSAWKREVLETAGVALSAGVRLVPADLVRVPLIEQLVAAGLDMNRPAFVSWLGVTMYLALPAIERTLHAGEPWVSSLTVDDGAKMLVNAGLEPIAQPLLIDWVDRSMWTRNDSIRPSRLWAMAHARAKS